MLGYDPGGKTKVNEDCGALGPVGAGPDHTKNQRWVSGSDRGECKLDGRSHIEKVLLMQDQS